MQVKRNHGWTQIDTDAEERNYVGTCTHKCINGLQVAELMEFDTHGKVRRVLAHYSGDAQ